MDIASLDLPAEDPDLECWMALGTALAKMTRENPDLAALARLRCFAGMEVSEAANALGIPRATAFRRWASAQSWLLKELGMSQVTPDTRSK